MVKKKGTVNKKAKKSKLSVKYVLQRKSSIANYEIYDDIVSAQDFLSSMEKVGISKDEFSLLEFHTEAELSEFKDSIKCALSDDSGDKKISSVATMSTSVVSPVRFTRSKLSSSAADAKKVASKSVDKKKAAASSAVFANVGLKKSCGLATVATTIVPMTPSRSPSTMASSVSSSFSTPDDSSAVTNFMTSFARKHAKLSVNV